MLSDTDTCTAFQVPSARKTILCAPAVPQAHTPARVDSRPATSAGCVKVSLSVCVETESFCCLCWTGPCDLQPPRTGGRLYTEASPSLGNLGRDQLWSPFTNWSLLKILSLTGADSPVHSRCSQRISWNSYRRCLKDQPPAARGLRGIPQSQLTNLSEGVNLTLWGL